MKETIVICQDLCMILRKTRQMHDVRQLLIEFSSVYTILFIPNDKKQEW